MPCKAAQATWPGTDIYLGLGSNLNNPVKQLNRAIKWLQRLPQSKVLRSAQWYQSPAWGVTAQNDFINTALHLKSQLTPSALLQHIKVIEYRLMQRQPNARWHARNIDIDLLLVGRQRHHSKHLCVPHPLIAERCFVTTPLLELKPQLPVKLQRDMLRLLASTNCHMTLSRLPAAQRRSGLKGTHLP
ncbi:2-amino-4-hydroxy-6-hydroxymethyldihydropteridine diphosphokinase [Marinicella meishanensis]|uniref:2-amino-4-hydroxy-6- hydroxymethyldihydropteridine diphosphokinase n=1 Tax=Marinicella meishanensis TaxID=2873263 RepID=UPI001CC066FB|nr:2-amino-4-hydroxy-6-hydroxymethyldihydropteridine diphosphokinase [Marinicella sp. NBU2979]